MRWIKASERLPQGHKKVHIKYQGDAFVGHKTYSEENPQMVFNSITRTFLTNDCEWLDESPSGSVSEAAKEYANKAQGTPQVYEAFIAGSNYSQSNEEKVKRLELVIEIKERERKEWADMCIAKQRKIERLTYLLHHAFNQGILVRPDDPDRYAGKLWEQFKTENNL